jgi:glutaredoxin 3
MPTKKLHKILLYRTSVCPWCHKTEEFLKENKIKFKAIDVGNDRKAAQEMIRKSGQMGVPVIDIDGQIIIGYDKARLEKALGL